MAMVDESRLEDDSVLLLLQSERYLGPHPFSLDLDLLWDEAREGLRTSRRELEETLRDLPEDDYSRHAPFNWEQVIEAKRSDIVPGVKTEELDRIAGQIESKLASMELPGDLRRHASRIADSVKQYRALSIRLTEIAEVAKRPEREAGTTIGELRTLAKDYDSILRLQ